MMNPLILIFLLHSSTSAGKAYSPTYLPHYAYQQQQPYSGIGDSSFLSHSSQSFLEVNSPDYHLSYSSPFGHLPKNQNKLKTKETGPRVLTKTGLRNLSKIEKRQEALEPAALPIRIPGIPRNPPWPVTVNVSNVIKLFQSVANDEEINDETEELLVQTLREVGSFIGLQDTRDLLGIFLMYFILGPFMVPLYWLPISLLALGFLMIPLVYKAPPGAAGRNSVVRASPFEESSNCIEMVSCEVTNTLRSSSWSSWVDERFNLTQVEYIGDGNRQSQVQEECSKYQCLVLKPIQKFFSSWYSYFFTYQNFLKPAADTKSANNSKTTRKHKHKQLRPINL